MCGAHYVSICVSSEVATLKELPMDIIDSVSVPSSQRNPYFQSKSYQAEAAPTPHIAVHPNNVSNAADAIHFAHRNDFQQLALIVFVAT